MSTWNVIFLYTKLINWEVEFSARAQLWNFNVGSNNLCITLEIMVALVWFMKDVHFTESI